MFSLVKSLDKTLFQHAYIKIEDGAATLGPNILMISGLTYGEKIFPGFQDVQRVMDHFVKRKIIILYDSSAKFRLPLGLGWLLKEIHSAFVTAKYVKNLELVLAYQVVSLLPFGISRMLRKRNLVYIGGSIYESFFQFGSGRVIPYASLLLWKLMIKLADLVIVPTFAVAKLSKLESSNIHEAPTRLFDPPFFKRYTIKKSFRERELVIGCVGRLTAEKNVLALAEAFQIMRRLIPNIRLLIVGDGPFRKKIERLDNGKKTVSVTGWVENVEDYLNEMKLLILPSKIEGLPNVILEAIACGTPVIATSVGAIPDIIKDGETGFLLKSNDPRHIAERIIELLNKPDLLEKVSINAYKYVRENFSCEKTLEAWRRILSKLDSK
jgi:glycosyltransferase involved in cell wall biosynthesis